MSAQERLAETLRANAEFRIGNEKGLRDRMAAAILVADPTIAEDLEFGSAWRAVVEALPEGWRFQVSGPTSDGRYVAGAHKGAVSGLAVYGPTPTAALLALRDRLGEMA